LKEYYQILGLEEGVTLEEVEKKYHKLLHEFNPDNQEGGLKDIFKGEYDNVKEAYKKILGNIQEPSSDDIREEKDQKKKSIISAGQKLDLDSLDKEEATVIGEKKEQKLNFEEVSEENNELVEKKIKYSWWAYDDEYISGWQYLGRSLVGGILSFILIGLYLNSVTAYKRAKSLGNSSSSCNFFSIWGFLSIIIGIIPGAGLINIIPHWYLWFSNGPGKY